MPILEQFCISLLKNHPVWKQVIKSAMQKIQKVKRKMVFQMKRTWQDAKGKYNKNADSDSNNSSPIYRGSD